MNLATDIDDVITCRDNVQKAQDLLIKAYQAYPHPWMRMMDQIEKSIEIIAMLDRRIAELKKGE